MILDTFVFKAWDLEIHGTSIEIGKAIRGLIQLCCRDNSSLSDSTELVVRCGILMKTLLEQNTFRIIDTNMIVGFGSMQGWYISKMYIYFSLSTLSVHHQHLIFQRSNLLPPISGRLQKITKRRLR